MRAREEEKTDQAEHEKAEKEENSKELKATKEKHEDSVKDVRSEGKIDNEQMENVQKIDVEAKGDETSSTAGKHSEQDVSLRKGETDSDCQKVPGVQDSAMSENTNGISNNKVNI